MKGFVSNPRVSIVAAIASLLILWAIIVVPGGPPWRGLVSVSVLAVLLAATAKLIRGSASSEVGHPVEPERTAGDLAPAVARSSAPR